MPAKGHPDKSYKQFSSIRSFQNHTARWNRRALPLSWKKPTMAIDTRQLTAFVCLARQKNFTAAAKELSLSQSAVSHSIRALEADLGCCLLQRSGKSTALTPAGEQLFFHAERILRDMKHARSALEGLKKWGHTRLRIMAPEEISHYFLPKVLMKFQEKFADCLFSVESGTSSVAMDLLDRNEIDFALGLQPKLRENCQFDPVFTDELFFIVPPSHAWAAGRQVKPDEIPTQRFIFYNKSGPTHQLLRDYFAREKLNPRIVAEFGATEAIKKSVQLGAGITILPLWVVQDELRDKRLVAFPLGKRKLKRDWGLIWRKSAS